MKFLAVLWFLLLACANAFPHSCATLQNSSDEEYLQQLSTVDSVIQGELTSVEDLGAQIFRVRFKVIRIWKGDDAGEVEALYGNPCGSPIVVGETFMVYGNRAEGESLLRVNCCNRTFFDDARTKALLGEGRAQETMTSAATPDEQIGFWTSLW